MVRLILAVLLTLSVPASVPVVSSPAPVEPPLLPEETPVVAPSPEDTTPSGMRDWMKQIVIAKAERRGVPPMLLVEACTKESQLRYNAKGLDVAARSKPRNQRTIHDYSYGLCQIKLRTAQWVWAYLVPEAERRRNIQVWHLDDPEFNSETAAIFLDWLHGRFHDWRLALAAYNVGPYDVTTRRLKTPGQLPTGKGSYAMSIWMRWQQSKLKAKMAQARITAAFRLAMIQSGPGGTTND